jgi:hypothetical protein
LYQVDQQGAFMAHCVTVAMPMKLHNLVRAVRMNRIGLSHVQDAIVLFSANN